MHYYIENNCLISTQEVWIGHTEVSEEQYNAALQDARELGLLIDRYVSGEITLDEIPPAHRESAVQYKNSMLNPELTDAEALEIITSHEEE